MKCLPLSPTAEQPLLAPRIEVKTQCMLPQHVFTILSFINMYI